MRMVAIFCFKKSGSVSVLPQDRINTMRYDDMCKLIQTRYELTIIDMNWHDAVRIAFNSQEPCDCLELFKTIVLACGCSRSNTYESDSELIRSNSIQCNDARCATNVCSYQFASKNRHSGTKCLVILIIVSSSFTNSDPARHHRTRLATDVNLH